MNQYTGECLCGACRYVITGQKPKAMYLCLCERPGWKHGAHASLCVVCCKKNHPCLVHQVKFVAHELWGVPNLHLP